MIQFGNIRKKLTLIYFVNNKILTMLEKSFYEIIFGTIPRISEVEMASKAISDYSGAHLGMLPMIMSDARNTVSSREFLNAKSAFASTMLEVMKLIEKDGAEVDYHIDIASKQLILCHYYYPQICDNAEIKALCSKLKKFNLL